jgi:hypothetical protein
MEVPHVVVSKFSEEHYDAFISNLHETTQKKYRNCIKDYKMFCTGKGIDWQKMVQCRTTHIHEEYVLCKSTRDDSIRTIVSRIIFYQGMELIWIM